MRMRYVGVLMLALALAGCVAAPVHQRNSHWLMLQSPVTKEYPFGSAFAPLKRWPRVTEYASLDTCQDSLWDTQDRLQRPVTCVASDDPRLERE